MPVLQNPRHEAFAQARFRGENCDQAYKTAGFTPNRHNAARLNTNEHIQARIAELQEKSASKTVSTVSFKATDLFERLLSTCAAAKAAGDYKAAIDGEKFVLRCFGYEDSPTLTHEQVRGEKLTQEPKDAGSEQDDTEALARQNAAQGAAMAGALKALRKYAS